MKSFLYKLYESNDFFSDYDYVVTSFGQPVLDIMRKCKELSGIDRSWCYIENDLFEMLNKDSWIDGIRMDTKIDDIYRWINLRTDNDDHRGDSLENIMYMSMVGFISDIPALFYDYFKCLNNDGKQVLFEYLTYQTSLPSIGLCEIHEDKYFNGYVYLPTKILKTLIESNSVDPTIFHNEPLLDNVRNTKDEKQFLMSLGVLPHWYRMDN